MQSAPRRLTLFDLIALIAAFGLSVAAAANLYPDINWSAIPTIWMNMVAQEGAAIGSAMFLAEASIVLLPGVAILALALLALRLRLPRPRRCLRIWTQPGSLACLAIAIATSISYFGSLAGMLARDAPIGPPPWLFINSQSPIRTAGTSVAAAWITLHLTGRWRPEPSWLDRAGRILGAVVLIGAGCHTIFEHFY